MDRTFRFFLLWQVNVCTLTKTGFFLSLLLSIHTPAIADWGSIGDGWKTLDGADVKQKPTSQTNANPPKTAHVRASTAQVKRPKSSTHEQTINRALVRSIAQKYSAHTTLSENGITPQEFILFFEAMIDMESRFNDKARSHVGAIGLAQLMPATAKSLNVNPYDKRENVEGGARYLLAQINEFGTLSLAVAAYNAGPQAVRKYNGVPPYRETERHVARVMSNFEQKWRSTLKE